MEDKRAIVYIEDDMMIRSRAAMCLDTSFPDYNIVTNEGFVHECVEEVLEECGGIEKIAIICTDGKLIGTTGWEVLKEFKKIRYTGPALYVGSSELPEKERDLYNGEIDKGYLLDNKKAFVDKIREYLD